MGDDDLGDDDQMDDVEMDGQEEDDEGQEHIDLIEVRCRIYEHFQIEPSKNSSNQKNKMLSSQWDTLGFLQVVWGTIYRSFKNNGSGTTSFEDKCCL